MTRNFRFRRSRRARALSAILPCALFFLIAGIACAPVSTASSLSALSTTSLAAATAAQTDPVENKPRWVIAASPRLVLDAACAPDTTAARSRLLADSLARTAAAIVHASGRAAHADTVLGALLLKLEGRFPDPADYRRATAHLAASGAERLLFLNDARLEKTSATETASEDTADPARPGCAWTLQAAVWNPDPLFRRAAFSVNARDIPDAAQNILNGILERLPENARD